jgi:hypothetical protein
MGIHVYTETHVKLPCRSHSTFDLNVLELTLELNGGQEKRR